MSDEFTEGYFNPTASRVIVSLYGIDIRPLSRAIIAQPLTIVNLLEERETVNDIYLEIGGIRYDASRRSRREFCGELDWLTPSTDVEPWCCKVGAVWFEMPKIAPELRSDKPKAAILIFEMAQSGKHTIKIELQDYRYEGD